MIPATITGKGGFYAGSVLDHRFGRSDPYTLGVIASILGRGNRSDRQLRTFNANRDIVEVVEEIADATEPVPVAA